MQSLTKTNATPRESEYLLDRRDQRIRFLEEHIKKLNDEHDEYVRSASIAEVLVGILLFVVGILVGTSLDL